ncbi:MAG TPA: response regulator transcription factor [Thermomicrobiales bacterium]
MVQHNTEVSRSGGSVVLVVDDEATIREAIAYNLKREGLDVEQTDNGYDALDRARTTKPDLVVLDVMLPGLDGFDVCRALRAESTVPILFLSARVEEIDRILGLELGGDDYLTKPFAMRELVARVRAMLRRAQMVSVGSGTPPPPVPSTAERSAGQSKSRPADRVLVVGDLSLDVARRIVRLRGEPVILKPKEFDLLAYLMRHPGIVLSRDALLREVWGYDYPIDTRTVDVHIRWLRLKLERDPSHPQWVETVRGYGYRFVGESESSPRAP